MVIVSTDGVDAQMLKKAGRLHLLVGWLDDECRELKCPHNNFINDCKYG
jgi:hypothetical protein